MTTIQLNARKFEIMEMLADVSDEKVLEKIVALIGKPLKKSAKTFERIPGLAYTQEERIMAIKEAEIDIEAGRTIPHAEIKKMVVQWGRD